MTIAEGVECTGDLEALQSAGCDLAQGLLISLLTATSRSRVRSNVASGGTNRRLAPSARPPKLDASSSERPWRMRHGQNIATVRAAASLRDPLPTVRACHHEGLHVAIGLDKRSHCPW